MTDKPDKRAIGKHTGRVIYGYEVFEDGRIKLSSEFANRLRAVQDRERALTLMHENIARFVASEMERVLKDSREWWSCFMDETGITTLEKYIFDNRTGFVHPAKDEGSAE